MKRFYFLQAKRRGSRRQDGQSTLPQVSPGAAHNSLTQDSPSDHIFTSFENGPGHLMGFYAPHTRRHWARGQRETRADILKTVRFMHAADFAGGSFCRRQFLEFLKSLFLKTGQILPGMILEGVQIWDELKRACFEKRRNCQ